MRRRAGPATLTGVRVLGRLVAWTAVLAVAVGAVVLLVPAGLGLSLRTPVAQLVAFRAMLGLGSLAAGLLVLAVVLAVVLARSRVPAPGVALAAVLLVAGLGHLGVAASRGVVNEPFPPPGVTGTGPAGAVTVLAVNTLGGAAGPEAVADLVTAVDADVVALPETGPRLAHDVADLLATRGEPVQVFSTGGAGQTVRSTSLLVAQSLGGYAQAPAPQGPRAVRAEPIDGVGPVLVAVHPSAPVPGGTQEWADELAEAVALCRATPGVVVAGDFNATLDHAPMRDLGGCVDAASARGWWGAGALGTWRADLPALLAAPIDHVLVDAGAWDVVRAGVLTAGESDHRAVVVRLVPRG